MDFAFTEEQNGIRAALKQLFGDLVTDESLKALEKEGKWFHEKAWNALAESEMLGLCLPESVGGADMGLFELCLLMEQVGRTVAPIPALPTLVSAGLPIAKYGTDAQRKRLLEGVVRGETILSAALVDTGTRDPRSPAAEASEAAGGFTLTGTFTNVQYARESQRILVPAKVGAEKIGIFLVDPEAAGVRIESQRGTNGEPLSLLVLEGASVSAEDVLGDAEIGAEILGYTLDRTLLAMCAMEYGVARQAMIMTATYSGERKQFGVPIGTFQAVKQRVADAYIDVQAVEVSMWQAAHKLEQGEDAQNELAVAKFFAAEGGARVLAAAQHVHGGMGFDRDYPLHRYFLTSKHLELTLGGANESLAEIGDRIVEGRL